MKRCCHCSVTAASQLIIILMTAGCSFLSIHTHAQPSALSALQKNFIYPPASSRPGVYWYFMDGNISKEAITADLESMQGAGIGSVVFLEVNVGVPRGPVTFFSEQWQELFAHAVHEAQRTGIDVILGTGPGWAGSGGPWVKPAASMQHLVASDTMVSGPGKKRLQLALPMPRKPYFGYGTLTPSLKQEWSAFYEDVAVLAYPTPDSGARIPDIDEKAFYYRAPYTSAKNVKPFLPSPANHEAVSPEKTIRRQSIIDLTGKLQPDGTLNWEVPAGSWTILRFVTRNNGAITRPAPAPGLGFEADKFDTTAMKAHLDHYVGSLLKKTGMPAPGKPGGLKRLHIDSWEMGAQNWTPLFRSAFKKRRGYDPLPYYPVYLGHIVESREISERFLWDLRQTSQELIIENHAQYVKEYGKRYGLTLSIEPYDMNPAADLELGAVADVPMCEFWSKGFGFNAAFSCIEGTSIGHVNGASVVAAEAFTAQDNEGWKQHPGSVKAQGDWAFATGINQLMYHTFQHQYLDNSLRPGMTMGPYGVHWDRNQTWWPVAAAYHRYIARNQYVLQQGRTVADILYLTPEGAPHVFRAPATALFGNDTLPDRKGFNFDGCSPGQLYRATVKNKKIVFPGGASYSVLVLPAAETMTPRLLQKISNLVKEGATVAGFAAPVKSPGLSGYPQCDGEVKTLAAALWNASGTNSNAKGRGKIISSPDLRPEAGGLYPAYTPVADLLHSMQVQEDFVGDTTLRYTHRETAAADIYFVANRTDKDLSTKPGFRITGAVPQLWDALTGSIYQLPEYEIKGVHTFVPLTLAAHQSFFVVFPKDRKAVISNGHKRYKNFPELQLMTTLTGSWEVSFDTAWGGPAAVIFDQLQDWTTRPESGIRYYSGKAVYRKQFHFARQNPAKERGLPAKQSGNIQRYFLELGDVKNLAVVTLNDHTLDTVWTAPWRVEITPYLKPNNKLEVTVINLWGNRLIGDEQVPEEGTQKRRYTFTTTKQYTKYSPLQPSGLLGPVRIVQGR